MAYEHKALRHKSDPKWVKDLNKYVVPETTDEDVTAATCYVINDRNLFFRYLAWMKAFPAVDPANQLGEVVKIMTAGQLTINNPRRLGVITAIT